VNLRSSKWLRHEPDPAEKPRPVPESFRIGDAGEVRWIEIKAAKRSTRSSDQAKKTDPHAVGHDCGERVVSHPEKCAITAVEKPDDVDRRERQQK
jgi:hypothetical protein